MRTSQTSIILNSYAYGGCADTVTLSWKLCSASASAHVPREKRGSTRKCFIHHPPYNEYLTTPSIVNAHYPRLLTPRAMLWFEATRTTICKASIRKGPRRSVTQGATSKGLIFWGSRRKYQKIPGKLPIKHSLASLDLFCCEWARRERGAEVVRARRE